MNNPRRTCEAGLRESTFALRDLLRACGCGGCKYFRLYQVEQVIAGLEARKKGGGRTEVTALGALMSGPCPTCKKSNWAAEVLYVDTETMGRRALGKKSFDSVPKGRAS